MMCERNERKDKQDLSERLLKFAVSVIKFLKTPPVVSLRMS